MSRKPLTPAEATDRVRAWRARFLAHPFLRAVGEAARGEDLDLHIVGGVPRDLLLGREPADIDLAVRPDPRPFVARLRDRVGGTLVNLDEDRATLRLVPPGEGTPFLDFARLRAETIEGDTRARDLTINAIAIPFEPLIDSAEVRWIDPTGGAQDIQRGLIRFASPQAPFDDPLRLLRAYRFACELGFRVTEDARALARQASEGIRRVAAERVSFELLRILGARGAARAMSDLDSTGVLSGILPEVEEMRGVTQNAYHHLDVLEHSLATLANMEGILADPGAAFPEARERIETFLDGADRRAALMLAALLHDVGKPRCRVVGPQGVPTFYGHAEVGAGLAGEALRRLRLPNRLVDLAVFWVLHHMRLASYESLLSEGTLSDRSLFRAFRKMGEEVVGEILLVLADLRAIQGPQRDPGAEGLFIDLGKRMLRLYFEEFAIRKAAPRLLTGHDLMERGMSEGPEIGRILREIEDAVLEGRVTTRGQALEFAEGLMLGPSRPPQGASGGRRGTDEEEGS